MRPLPRTVWRRIIADYLRRDQAPLSPGDWAAVDAAVAESHAAHAVGRRFLPVQEGVAPGIAVLPGGPGPGRERRGRPERGLSLGLVHSDFPVPPRGPGFLPAVLRAGREAARTCALAEDHLILHGHPALGHQGLLGARGRNVLPLGDWRRPERAREDLIRGLERLVRRGFRGPFALVLHPDRLAAAGPGGWPPDLARSFAAGIVPTWHMGREQVLIASVNPDTMDLAVAQPLTTAYLPAGEAGQFRVFALVALRTKDPGAICTLEAWRS
ncbi:MAG: family 1 encapsulin nanocompartment shell protein [Bacillota bacterium]